MPYANNMGVRIYYEVEGQGVPLVLAHGAGFGGNLNMWRATGYTDILKNHFRLIMFDFRGYGRSDDSGEIPPEESDPNDDIVSVLDDIGIPRAHYFGYSLGAAAGFRQAILCPHRFQSFILGGMTPLQWPETMIAAARISRELAEMRRTDPGTYFIRMEQMLKRTLSVEERNELLERDARAEGGAYAPHRPEPPLQASDLSKINVPCLLFCGDEDPFHNGAQESVNNIPHGVFISMHGLNHITAIQRSDVVAPLVIRFLSVISDNS